MGSGGGESGRRSLQPARLEEDHVARQWAIAEAISMELSGADEVYRNRTVGRLCQHGIATAKASQSHLVPHEQQAFQPHTRLAHESQVQLAWNVFSSANKSTSDKNGGGRRGLLLSGYLTGRSYARSGCLAEKYGRRLQATLASAETIR